MRHRKTGTDKGISRSSRKNMIRKTLTRLQVDMETALERWWNRRMKKIEEEIKDLPEAEALELLEMYGASETGLHQLIKVAYDTLGLQSYLTAGQKEVRAWTIHKGDTAPQAAGVIHTDFERGFIAAAIVDYDELVAAGSEQAAKAAGKMRTEGRDYVMQPGDVVEFRFNV